jgi:hypothetical protein
VSRAPSCRGAASFNTSRAQFASRGAGAAWSRGRRPSATPSGCISRWFRPEVLPQRRPAQAPQDPSRACSWRSKRDASDARTRRDASAAQTGRATRPFCPGPKGPEPRVERSGASRTRGMRIHTWSRAIGRCRMTTRHRTQTGAAAGVPSCPAQIGIAGDSGPGTCAPPEAGSRLREARQSATGFKMWCPPRWRSRIRIALRAPQRFFSASSGNVWRPPLKTA